MIFTERNITIRNDSATINAPVILYRGDKNVEVRFILIESPYKYSNRDSINIFESTDASYAQLVIKTPNDREPIFGDITAVGNNNVTFVIRHDMIDEIEEVGKYDFQIRLFDADQTSMATTPEVVGGFIIKEPIAKEDTTNNITNSAIVGSAVVTNDVEIPTFAGGSYNKTAWHDGVVISRQKLDKIENGIYETYELSKDNSSQIKERATQNELALERARIDNLTTLSEGSTTGDAELIDGRIGADGVTYANIGSAVRTQFTDIKNNINTITTISINLFDYNKISCKNFHNGLNAFQEQTDANWVLSDYIAVKQNDIFRAKFPNIATYSAYVVELGSKSESDILRYTKLQDWCDTCEITITNSDTKYVKLSIGVFKDSNWKNIVMITVNNIIPNTFIPYGKILKDEFKVETLRNEFENYINAGTGYKYFVPNNLYLIKNRNGTRRLMLENMVVAHNLNSFYLSNSTGLLWNQAENYKLINDADSREQGDNVELFIKTTDKKVKTFVYNIRCVGSDFVTNPASQKNVLMIGDSFTDQGYLPCEVKNILINDLGLTNLNFIGRKTDTDTNSNVTCLNEGNGGITLLDYIKTDNTEGRGTGWSNPFLFNGSVSYTQYMSNNNFSGDLDIVVIECGVNDILVYGSDESTLSARLKTMIDTIHTEYPNCKIFVVGQKYASDVTDYVDAYKWNNKIMDMNLAYQNLCESDDYKSFCYYVDCGLTFDKLYGSKYEKKLLYKGSEEQVIKVTDWLHPNIMGYYQIAENIASAIAYNCFKS